MRQSIPVAQRSKARVCGRSLVRIAVSNPGGGMDVSVLLVLSVVRGLCKGADPSSRGDLPTMMCNCE